MTTFSELPEFEKELKKLSKKYPSLVDDIGVIKPILIDKPEGIGKNFTLLNSSKSVKIIKVRVHCESLRSRAIRMIYAYHPNGIEFMYIEIYFKGDKENEDRDRIKDYIKRYE